MKAYTFKHIITIIVVIIISGGIFGFCFGWQYGLAVGSVFLAFSLTLFFRNPTYPSFAFGHPDWMNTQTVWKCIGCTMMFVAGVVIISTAMAEDMGTLAKAVLLPAGYILSLLSGYLTRQAWVKNMPKQ